LGTTSTCMDPPNQAESRRVKKNLRPYMAADSSGPGLFNNLG
jgi:hypothetical protein